MQGIQIKNITKKYNGLTALDNVSFSFEFGKIYGFLGRNGAGKSTLINVIANRIFADEGKVIVDDASGKRKRQGATKKDSVSLISFCLIKMLKNQKEFFKWIVIASTTVSI